jgi:hypothetical protein
VTFILWCILLVLCWPLALLALVVYPIVWLILLPFRILGIAVEGVLELLRGILFLPGRLLRGSRCALRHTVPTSPKATTSQDSLFSRGSGPP